MSTIHSSHEPPTNLEPVPLHLMLALAVFPFAILHKIVAGS